MVQSSVGSVRRAHCYLGEPEARYWVDRDGGGHWISIPVGEALLDQKSSCDEATEDNEEPKNLRHF